MYSYKYVVYSISDIRLLHISRDEQILLNFANTPGCPTYKIFERCYTNTALYIRGAARRIVFGYIRYAFIYLKI